MQKEETGARNKKHKLSNLLKTDQLIKSKKKKIKPNKSNTELKVSKKDSLVSNLTVFVDHLKHLFKHVVASVSRRL